MKRLMLIAPLLLTATQSALAVGALYARPPLSSQAGVPLWLKQYNADCRITDQMAVTHVDQTFANETSSRLEGVFIFPLPPNAVVIELALWINGVRQIASVMEKDSARLAYESVVRKSIDPALLEDMGNNIFKLSVFPIDPKGSPMAERRIEITYAELLPFENGTVSYGYFMKSVDLSSKPALRSTLTIDLASQKPIISLVSPTHTGDARLIVTHKSDYAYSIIYGDENADSASNLQIDYRYQNAEYSLTHLTYAPDPPNRMPFDSTGDNPYFLLWVTPPLDTSSSRILPKDIVLVADISSSMAGTRIVQLRQALNSMVDMLNAEDRFNIVAFNTAVQTLAPNLITVSRATRDEAHGFINGLSEIGLTDIEDALKTALASNWDQTHATVIVFLTDGKPTWPLSSTCTSILDTVAARNRSSAVSIHTFGVGADVDSQFLSKLAADNNGFAMRILTDNAISTTLSTFMRKISYPLIKNTALNYGTLRTYDVYPKVLPSLYAGAQLAVLGRYTNTGNATITFTGTQRGSSMQLVQALDFPSKAANNPVVPRVWASAKIDALLKEIAVYGQQTELVNQVKYLGKRYGIITPYTSMVVIERPSTGINSPLIEDKTGPSSLRFELAQNLPNPFTSSTTLHFTVPRQNSISQMVLKIYDSQGKLVRTIVNEPTIGGRFMISWNCRDDKGAMVAPGLYLAVLRVGKMQQMVAMRMAG